MRQSVRGATISFVVHILCFCILVALGASYVSATTVSCATIFAVTLRDRLKHRGLDKMDEIVIDALLGAFAFPGYAFVSPIAIKHSVSTCRPAVAYDIAASSVYAVAFYLLVFCGASLGKAILFAAVVLLAQLILLAWAPPRSQIYYEQWGY